METAITEQSGAKSGDAAGNQAQDARSSASETARTYSGGRREVIIETRPKGDISQTVSIASISDQDWYVSRTHGVYHLPARAKGEAYALLLVTSRGDVIDLGDNRRFPFTITAREIAHDLLQDLHDHGIFVCAGARPSAEELAAATERRDAYYHRLMLGHASTNRTEKAYLPFVPELQEAHTADARLSLAKQMPKPSSGVLTFASARR